MKNKKILMVVAIMVISIFIVCITFRSKALLINKLNSNIDNTEQSKDNNEVTDSEIGVDESISKDKLKSIENYMNLFDSIAFVKIVSQNTYNDDKNDFSQQQYILSEINILKGEDNTIDYLKTSKTYLKKIDFQEIFGFNIKDYYEPFSFVNELIKSQGFSSDLTNASLDKEMYKLTGQKSYILEEDSDIIQNIIKDLDYDKILDSYCYFTIKEAVSGESYINCITAQVTYTKNNIVSYSNLDFVIQIYNQDGSNHPDGDITL